MRKLIRQTNGLASAKTRRGTLYIAVLLTATIVSLLGITALSIRGLQVRSQSSNLDVVEARLYAQAAVRLAMLKIENDPDWRYTQSNGAWITDSAIGNGTLSLDGTDPADGDLADAPEETLLLTGTGKKGDAVQRMSVTLVPKNRAWGVLDSALHTGSSMTFSAVNLNGSGTISTNGSITGDYYAGNSSTQLAAQAAGSIDDYYGAIQFHNGSRAGVTARTTPDTNSVFDYYKNRGTWIAISDLVTSPVPPIPPPVEPPNLLANPGFENGTSPWFVWSNQADPALSSDSHSGTQSLQLSQRASAAAGVNYDMTAFLQSGTAYDASAWVKLPSGSEQMYLGWAIKTVGSTMQTFAGQTVDVGDTWTKISETFVPEWSGTLETAVLFVAAKTSTTDFLVDDWELFDPSSLSLPLGTNIISNGDFENGVTNWSGSGCPIAASSTAHGGSGAIQTTNRNALTDTVQQDLTASLDNQATWHTDAWIQRIGSAATVRIELHIQDGVNYYSPLIVPLTEWRTAPADAYVRCYGQTTVSWTGNLQSAKLVVAHQSDVSGNFHLDDVAMIQVNPPPPPAHTIYRSVLSPASNPFGNGTTNQEGIYVVDCQNQDVHIQDSRLAATLVLLNAGSGTSVRSGNISWEPARTNFPALLVEGNLAINAQSDGLSESELAVNFNPTGTPLPFSSGTSDADETDTHLSEITGLIYATGNLQLSGALTLNGALIAAGSGALSGTHTFNGTSMYQQNPPPGFSGAEEIHVLLKSAQKSLLP